MGGLISIVSRVAFEAVDSKLRSLADPYGSALWPSALVLAQGLAAYDLKGKQVLELGAGCGLASLVVSAPTLDPIKDIL